MISICLLLALAESLLCPPVDYAVVDGWSSNYDAGVMEATIAWRQDHEQLPDDLSYWYGFVAVLECVDVGETVWIRPYGKANWRPFLATDCAGKEDGGYSWMLSDGILAEFDKSTANLWCDGSCNGFKIEMATKE